MVIFFMVIALLLSASEFLVAMDSTKQQSSLAPLPSALSLAVLLQPVSPRARKIKEEERKNSAEDIYSLVSNVSQTLDTQKKAFDKLVESISGELSPVAQSPRIVDLSKKLDGIKAAIKKQNELNEEINGNIKQLLSECRAAKNLTQSVLTNTRDLTDSKTTNILQELDELKKQNALIISFLMPIKNEKKYSY